MIKSPGPQNAIPPSRAQDPVSSQYRRSEDAMSRTGNAGGESGSAVLDHPELVTNLALPMPLAEVAVSLGSRLLAAAVADTTGLGAVAVPAGAAPLHPPEAGAASGALDDPRREGRLTGWVRAVGLAGPGIFDGLPVAAGKRRHGEGKQEHQR